MMRNKFTLLMFSATALLFSCGDDLEIPNLEPSFVLDPEAVEVGLPVMFDNTTLNANEYSWDFGDGNTSTEISPSHTYEEPGSYEVILTASAVDGQNVEFSQIVDVLQRVFVAYQVTDFPLDNDGTPWDADEASADSLNAEFPDVVVALFPSENDQIPSYQDPFFLPNLTETLLVAEVTQDAFSEDIVLTNEPWTFIIADLDGDPADAGSVTFETMTGVEFNPVTASTIKSTDSNGDVSGVISIFAAFQNGEILDIDLFFELR